MEHFIQVSHLPQLSEMVFKNHWFYHEHGHTDRRTHAIVIVLATYSVIRTSLYTGDCALLVRVNFRFCEIKKITRIKLHVSEF